MTTPIRPFSYDVVLTLDASREVREMLPRLAGYAGTGCVLAATLNHRFYNLAEKNRIKGSIEAHGLDHLMLSMRPSAQRLVAAWGPDAIYEFREMAQLVFVLQVMARHAIPRAIVRSRYFDAHRVTASVADIVPLLEQFLVDVSARAAAQGLSGPAARKLFPWLFSIEAKLPQLKDSELVAATVVQAHPFTDPVPLYDDGQITPMEEHLFWVGFDPSFKAVPVDKPYPRTKWTTVAETAPTGEGTFAGELRYCTRCCLPETMEGISFDDMGICVPCRSSEEKMHIDWTERRARLDEIIDGVRSDTYYDCMLPMSGGKDSAYQAHLLRQEFGVTALAVTHGQNWLSVVGRYNLENCLQQFDLDHLVFNMNRRVINAMARKSLGAIGDACWHCHIGAGTFPVLTALAWEIDLMCYGESIAESDGRGSYHGRAEASLFYNLEVSARVTAQSMADSPAELARMSAWVYPDRHALKQTRVRYIHLGDYFFWDEERQVEFVKRHYGWMEANVENAFKGFKSVECVMAGVHDYANFIKRGIGRSTVQASTDVRRGVLTREEGFELAKAYDSQRPHALDFYLQLTGLSEGEFEDSLRTARARSTFASKLSR